MQRKLFFYVTREKQAYLLHAIQISRKTKHEAQNENSRLWWYLNNDYTYHEIFDREMKLFHDRSNQFAFYSYRREYDSSVTVDDDFSANSSLVMRSRAYELPSDLEPLLMFIGALDNSVHSMEINWGYDNLLYSTTYSEISPDLSSRQSFCSQLMRDNKPAEDKQTHLSRFVVTRMRDLLAQGIHTNPKHVSLNERLTFISHLGQLLKSESSSLTRVIRERLYPSKPIAELLTEHCTDVDSLTLTLLNQTGTYEDKTTQLFEFISTKLAAKTNQKDIIANDDASANSALEVKKQIHQKLHEWFEVLEKARKKLWLGIISDRLIGQPTPDNGQYNIRYTEIQLMLQAQFVLNTAGLIELQFHHTNSYNIHYGVGCRLHDVLEKELRVVFAYLDLHFLPNQDFHERAVFDLDSSKALKNWGFHFSELFCKERLLSENICKHFDSKRVKQEWQLQTLDKGYFLRVGFFVNRLVECENQKRIEEEKRLAQEKIEAGEPLTLSLSL